MRQPANGSGDACASEPANDDGLDKSSTNSSESTESLCPVCKDLVPARVEYHGGAVYLAKTCPDHGPRRALLASSEAWYRDAASFAAKLEPPTGRTARENGCPFDCGPCEAHEQNIVMPVIPITSACNLDCPICYTVNKNHDPHMLSEDDFAEILAQVGERAPDLDIINFTGGEPTLHPQLPRLLHMSREAGIRRLTVSTNGLRLRDEDYVKELADADARVVLSLDTFDENIDRTMLGATTVKTKLRAVELLGQHDVTTTLLPAVAAGLNDADLGRLFDLMMSKPNICSLEVHTLTFTGQGGADFDRRARITTPDIHRILELHTDGSIEPNDFVPSPLAHPHCYSICYLLLLDGGGYVPYARLVGRQTLFELLGESLYIQPGRRVEDALREAMNNLWMDPDMLPDSERLLETLRRLLLEMFPADRNLPQSRRQRIAERATKAVYIHSHMDEETFDVARVKACGITVPEVDGSTVPTCAYNVLYRENDPRFADPARLERMGRSAPHQKLCSAARERYRALGNESGGS